MQRFFTFTTFFLLISLGLHAQDESIIVVNGGLFGSTNYANTTIQTLEPNAAPAVNMGTVEVTSIQDILIDSNYAYVAMQDSIVKYDWTTRTKVAAAAFGSVSTVKLALYQDKLLVGNFYGSTNNNLRIFDAATLTYLDSVPEVTKPVEDMLIIGDYAYIGQNNAKTVGFGDTLGYLLTYDIMADTIVSWDTLNNMGYEIGRLVEQKQNGTIYALNNTSNTISSYTIASGASSTVPAGVDLRLATYGPAAYEDNGVWYFPYDSGIGSYSLIASTPLVHRVTTSSSTFAFNPYNSTFCVATTNFGNQSANTGMVYDLQGDSLYNFEVGFSPEALVVVSNAILSNQIVPAQGEELTYTLAPNPASTQIRVNLEKVEPVRLEIINQVGQTMRSQQSNQSTTTVDISQLPTGTYWMVVVNKKGRLRTKAFTKQ